MHGKLFTTLRCDSGTIEMSSELRRLCADVNGLGNQGVEIREAGLEQQNQNPVEIHIQSVDNQANANLLVQDILSSAWWGIML